MARNGARWEQLGATVISALLVLLHCQQCLAAQAATEGGGAASPAPEPESEAIYGQGVRQIETIPVDALVFVVVALFAGVLVYHWLAFVPVPYTAILLLIGVALGTANEAGAHWDKLGGGLYLWERIDPKLLLAAFLPVLLFGGAFQLHWHTVRKEKWQILLLAGPGVLLGMALLAVLLKYTFPYGWSWVQCLLVGAMMSATDPVATLAVLSKVGASVRLRTLVDSESLVNDGSAYVMFFLLKGWVEGKHQSPGDAIRVLVQLSVGGPALGIAAGVITTVWLRFMYNNALAEITLTIVAAYGTYVLADELLDVSGVLAVVALGMWIAAKGKYRVSRHVESSLHVVWEVLEHIANTLVFVLSGVIIAGRIWISEHGGVNTIQPSDYGYAFLLWAYLMLIRAFMVLLFSPILRRTGYGLTFKEAIVVSWAGLRGAVGLALALYLLLDESIDNVRYRVLSFFFMGMIAAITLIVQGSTTSWLLQALGLTKPPAVQKQFLAHLVDLMEEEGSAAVRDARATDKLLGNPDWDALKRATMLDTHKVLGKPGSLFGLFSFHDRLSPADRAERARAAVRRMDRAGLLADKRARLLRAVRATYNELFEKSSTVYQLVSSCDQALDHVDAPLCDWACLQSHCLPSPTVVRIYRMMAGRPWLQKAAQQLLYWNLGVCITRAAAFAYAHEDAVKDIVRFEKLEEALEEALEEEEGLDPRQEQALEAARRKVSLQVISESGEEVKAAKRAVAALQRAFPEVAMALATAHLAQRILLKKEAFVAEVGRTGLIQDTEVGEMGGLVEKRLKALHFRPPPVRGAGPADLLRQMRLFAALPPDAFKALLKEAKLRIYLEGQPLTKFGRAPKHVYALLRGSVAARPHGAAKQRGLPAAAVLGALPVLLAQPPPLHLTAASLAEVYKIPAATFLELVREYPEVKEAAWRAAAAEGFVAVAPQLRDVPFHDLRAVLATTEVQSFAAGRTVLLSGCTLLLSGTLELLAGSHTSPIMQDMRSREATLDSKAATTDPNGHVAVQLPPQWPQPVPPALTSPAEHRRHSSDAASEPSGSSGDSRQELEAHLQRVSTVGPLPGEVSLAREQAEALAAQLAGEVGVGAGAEAGTEEPAQRGAWRALCLLPSEATTFTCTTAVKVVAVPPRGDWPEPDNIAKSMMAMPEFRDWSMRHQSLRKSQRVVTPESSLSRAFPSLRRAISTDAVETSVRQSLASEHSAHNGSLHSVRANHTATPAAAANIGRLNAQTDHTKTI